MALRRESNWTRQAISVALCEHLQWRKPDGALKDMSARVALLRMHRDGLIELPPSRRTGGGKPKDLAQVVETDWPSTLIELPQDLRQVRPLHFEIIKKGPRSRIWNSFVERYHYLGYKPLPGAQMRYPGPFRRRRTAGAARFCSRRLEDRTARSVHRLVSTMPRAQPASARQQRPLFDPCLGFASPTWLPIFWHAAKNALPHDWLQRYSIHPAMLETFCEIPRFVGTCYQAANWIRVGQTQGRGKLDVRNEYALPIKDIWLKPLHRNWKTVLNS